MLIENGDARILMDSKLTTTNNREARLHIGDKIPYVIQSYNLSAAGGVNQQVMKEEVGVIIKMTPHINEEGQITLALEPEVSSISGWKGSNADIPLVRVRKTSTTVRVEDGQPILLAGLISEDKTTTVHQVPVLGQIPIIGLLFQHKRDEVRRTNLIIEITPHIIKNPADISFTATVNESYNEGKKSEGKTEKEKAITPVNQQTTVQPQGKSAAPAPGPDTNKQEPKAEEKSEKKKQ
jgi:general secretion pathway protein D